MAVTEYDIEQFAARIRLHFEPHLRDVAYDLALGIARVAGARVKALRPETMLGEIVAWIKEGEPFAAESLDPVEWMMVVEEELGFKIPDRLAVRIESATFRELVLDVSGNFV